MVEVFKTNNHVNKSCTIVVPKTDNNNQVSVILLSCLADLVDCEKYMSMSEKDMEDLKAAVYSLFMAGCNFILIAQSANCTGVMVIT